MLTNALLFLITLYVVVHCTLYCIIISYDVHNVTVVILTAFKQFTVVDVFNF